jgi:hypothetical protein
MAEGITINGRHYTATNTNDYERVIIEMIQHERSIYAQLHSSGASAERLLKQQGVIEHYCELLQEFDGIEQVQHLFEPILAK